MLSFILYRAVKSDLSTRTIPDECSLAICILAVGAGGFSLQRLTMAVVCMFIFAFAAGFGDAKLFGALTLLFGSRILYVIAFAYGFACIFCLAGVISKRLKPGDTIPFAPFIAIPALALFLV